MRIIAVFLFLVIIFPLYGQQGGSEQNKAAPPEEKNYGISAGLQFGFIHGQSIELVYPYNTKRELLSELLWDMKPVFYFGIKADFGKRNIMKEPGFFASLSFKSGIPSDSGIMEDRDWQSKENVLLTNYSRHTNKTRKLYFADISAGASIPIKSAMYIKPFISGSWMHFSFSARDGYLRYAEEKGDGVFGPFEDAEKVLCSGELITYEQDWLLLAAGFSLGTEIFHPFLFNISFKISPIAYCAAIDEHIMKNATYKDIMYFGIFVEPAACISLVYKQFEFSLDLAYRNIDKAKGKSYVKTGDSKYFLLPSEAGAGLSALDISLTASYHF